MSTADKRADGVAGVMDAHLRNHQADIHAAAVDSAAEQLDLLAPVTPEEFLEARSRLPDGASNLDVVREARRGRPPGSRNRRTDDFSKYLLSLGEHPAITMVRINDTDPAVLIEQSSILGDGRRKMTLLEALSLQVRCAEGLLPYIEGKAPQRVDVRIDTDGIMIFPGITDPERLAASIIDDGDVIEGSFMEIDEDDER